MNFYITNLPQQPNNAILYPLIVNYSASTGIFTFQQQNVTQITTSSVTIKPVDTTVYSVNINDLLKQNDCKDHSAYAVYANGKVQHYFSGTVITKQHPGEFLQHQNPELCKLFDIIVPVASDISTVSIRATVEIGRNITIDGDLTEISTVVNTLSDLLPTVSIGEPTNTNQVLSFPVTVSADVTVLYTSTLGVVLTPELKGSGNVLVSVAGIPTGLSGNLKASFKYWTNKANVNFTV